METKDMLYIVSEYASQGEIFGKQAIIHLKINRVKKETDFSTIYKNICSNNCSYTDFSFHYSFYFSFHWLNFRLSLQRRLHCSLRKNERTFCTTEILADTISCWVLPHQWDCSPRLEGKHNKKKEKNFVSFRKILNVLECNLDIL